MAARHRGTRVRTAIIATLAVVATSVGGLGASAAPVAADDVQVAGSGLTFAGIAIDQWRADAAQHLGLRVSHNATGLDYRAKPISVWRR